tara:strand:- start:4696 stop:4830 length:135 start_codon:yes stop_codon:yes gene_type:complete
MAEERAHTSRQARQAFHAAAARRGGAPRRHRGRGGGARLGLAAR